jgi:transcriptional regulator with XRE-family HTH domain
MGCLEFILPTHSGESQQSGGRQHGSVPASHRLIDRAVQRAVRARLELGRELRGARSTRGLSQAFVAGAAGVSQPQLSRIERGASPNVTIESLSRVATVLGLDLSVRLFPGGPPLRDMAHANLLHRFRTAVGEDWHWAAEVPLPLPGDRRRWDRLLRRPGVVIGVEAETRPTDMQELQGRLALKKRDGQADRLILVLADTAWCRSLVRLNDLETSFPVPGRVALRALSEGREPGGDAVILI